MKGWKEVKGGYPSTNLERLPCSSRLDCWLEEGVVVEEVDVAAG